MLDPKPTNSVTDARFGAHAWAVVIGELTEQMDRQTTFRYRAIDTLVMEKSAREITTS
jgi:hypothetical protein